MNTDKLLIPFTATVFGLLVFNVWLNWPTGGPPRTVPCPKCGQEQVEGQDCAKCRTGKSRSPGWAGKDTAPARARGTVAFGLVGLTAALLGGYLFLRSRLRPASEEVEPNYLRCRCNQCKRRLRYVAQPIARKILCPKCRSEVDVPAAEPVEPSEKA